MRTNKQTQAQAFEDREHVLRQIGQYLRDLRQSRGEDLYDVAGYLRIRPSYLFAIEEGDLSTIPGSAYAIGFIRTYCDYLGAETKTVVDETRYALTGMESTPDKVAPNPQPEAESKRPTGKIVALSALAAVVMVIAWQVRISETLLPGNLVALGTEISQGLRQFLAQDSTQAPADSAEQTSIVAGTNETARTPSAALLPDPEAELAMIKIRREQLLESTANSRVDASSALAAEPRRQIGPERQSGPVEREQSATQLLAALQARDDAEAGRIRNNAPFDDGSRVALVAIEETWIQVRSSSRDYVRTRTLLVGERMALPNRDDLSLSTGNAGGLQIMVDGETLGTPGNKQEIIKDLPLAPLTLLEKLQAPVQNSG